VIGIRELGYFDTLGEMRLIGIRELGYFDTLGEMRQ
jgi:hypothetical protein